MRLGGLVKTSTLDFPSTLSAVVFTRGCNFRCPYCHNPSLVGPGARSARARREAERGPEAARPGSSRPGPSSGDRGAPAPAGPRADAAARSSAGSATERAPDAASDLDPESVLAFLAKRRGQLEGVVVSGGEPTCQDPGRLSEFLAKIKALGYAVKLDTNGSRPGVLAALLAEGLVDYLAVDLKGVPGRYHPALADPAVSAPVAETVELVLARGRAAEFRTTCASPFADRGVITEIARAARGPVPLFLQAYRPGTVLDADFMARQGPQPGPEDLSEMYRAASAWLPCNVR